jgi:hypothetical protein
VEQWDTGAEQRGVDVQANLIDQIRFKECTGELAAVHQADVLAGLLLQVPHKYSRKLVRKRLEFQATNQENSRIDLAVHETAAPNSEKIMNEIVTCPECQRRLKLPGEYVGRQVTCPQCSTTFTAGLGQAASPTPDPTLAAAVTRRLLASPIL